MSKIFNSKRLYSNKGKSISEVNTKKYALKLPNITTNNPPINKTGQKLKVIQLNDEESEMIIDKFILPDGSDVISDAPKKQTLPKLRNLVNNFSIEDDELLPLEKPYYIKDNPFEFHSTYNSDLSYVNIPRLSVTKLLTDQWCELRDFYTVYSGSPVKEPTKEMKLGNETHIKLELETHKLINTSALSKQVDRLIEEQLDVDKEKMGLLTDLQDISIASEKLNMLLEDLDGAFGESMLATDWFDKIIGRLFTLITTSEAREVLLHGYLNFETSTFVSKGVELPLDKNKHVLVSGVVDYLKIFNPENELDYSMFKDIQDYIEFSFPTSNKHHSIDLSKFLEYIKTIIKEYNTTYNLRITDVKTRSWNKIPHQESVLNAAKLQACYYRRMFGILAGEFDNDGVAYNMLLENATRRNLDIDKPISLKTVLILLRTNSSLIYNDFVKLANGDPIGFGPYDDFVKKTYLEKQSDYDLTKLFTVTNINTFLDRIQEAEGSDFDYAQIFTADILKPWKTPLTLRYFAARASQLFNVYEPIISDNLSIEYHNGKTGQCFHINHYKYDFEELESETKRATTLWNGSRSPVPVHDLSKCNYCDFSPKCSIPNPDKNAPSSYGSVGSKIKQFIHT